MKPFSAGIRTALVAASVIATVVTGARAVDIARCKSITERKEILDLTAEEWGMVQSTLSWMQREGWFKWFSYIHTEHFSQIHGTSQFLPFHRRFLQDFESTGQKFNQRFFLPYWDEFRDYRSPAKSPVLSSEYLGGNGQGAQGCVSDGVQGGWTMEYPESHCLGRAFSNGSSINPWYSAEYISSVLQRDDSMAKFRPDIEFTVHGAAHVGLGGDMATRTSTNDFAFMVHHAFVDSLWAAWQERGHQMTMDGPGSEGEGEVTLKSLVVFYSETVESVMRLGWGKMCYRYTGSRLVPGSSDMARKRQEQQAVDAAVQDNMAASLPEALLRKWFPGVEAKAGSNHWPLLPRPTPPLPLQPLHSLRIPLPAALPDEWISMHGYDRSQVLRVVGESREFVREMNAAGYTPLL
ncbi:Di-copper centre-containing protein [Martensiomyces pterosporus]|nr:Di-copper centre-containing protein [Martensiomyces pterosporus]